MWENGEGASGEGSGNLVVELGGVTELLKELVEGQRALVEEVRNLGEAIVWGRDPLRDAEDYADWLGEWDEEELDGEIAGLEGENNLFWEFLKGVAKKQSEGEEGEMEMEIE
jgi:hypothetical protein